jgi:hypothetical protein
VWFAKSIHFLTVTSRSLHVDLAHRPYGDAYAASLAMHPVVSTILPIVTVSLFSLVPGQTPDVQWSRSFIISMLRHVLHSEDESG